MKTVTVILHHQLPSKILHLFIRASERELAERLLPIDKLSRILNFPKSIYREYATKVGYAVSN